MFWRRRGKIQKWKGAFLQLIGKMLAMAMLENAKKAQKGEEATATISPKSLHFMRIAAISASVSVAK